MPGEEDARSGRGRLVTVRLADLDLMDPAVQQEWYPATHHPRLVRRSLHISSRRA